MTATVTAASTQIEQLKHQCRLIITAVRDENTNIWKPLLHLKYILKHYDNTQVYNDECREYIVQHFLENAVIALLKRQHQNFQTDWNMADEIKSCCKLLVKIAVPLIKDDSELAMQIIYYCMNPSNPFNTHFGHDWVKLIHSNFWILFT